MSLEKQQTIDVSNTTGVVIYVYWSYTWLYQLRFLFYVCFLCIYLRLLVLSMVISVEDLVLCLFSLYLFTSTGPKHGYIS
jgi:hypothetical protein